MCKRGPNMISFLVRDSSIWIVHIHFSHIYKLLFYLVSAHQPHQAVHGLQELMILVLKVHQQVSVFLKFGTEVQLMICLIFPTILTIISFLLKINLSNQKVPMFWKVASLHNPKP